MPKEKKNHLLEATIELFKHCPKGRVLDLGCGDGDYAKELHDLGFDVVAGDIDEKRFRYHGQIPFQHCDITRPMPFGDGSFDYVLLMETVEHLRNPYDVFSEINRIVKKDGHLILSTPNILNLKSRFRYLIEGTFDYFREPPLDQAKNPKEIIFNLHIMPYRYQELEYLLRATGFDVADVTTSVYDAWGYAFLLPLIRFQAKRKEVRSFKKKGLDYRRINRIILSWPVLFGRHLIVKAKKIE